MSALEYMTNDRLRVALEQIDADGWESQAGRTLLTQVRVQLVRPIVARSGLTGQEAAQAEATGWAEAWESLSSPYLRTTARPWNVLWTTVRRAVRTEVLSARLVTGGRRAWEMAAHETGAARRGESTPWAEHHMRPPLSLDLMAQSNQAPPAAPETRHLGETLDAVVDVMVAEGWPLQTAWQAVGAIAVNARRDGEGVRGVGGWRQIAQGLGLPQWQVRRLAMILVGAPGWPGVVECVRENGMDVLQWPSTRLAIRTTLNRELLTPSSRPLRAPADPRSATPRLAS